MAYIEITDEMVDRAQDSLTEDSGAIITKDEVRAALKAAFAAGEIRSEPEPAAAGPRLVTVYLRTSLGLESYRVPVDGQECQIHGAVVDTLAVQA